ncbi:hypothetical protein A2U01_0117819, partial [Trifolium medium]|nr:hypothetical protein [Trifolium medium]
AAPRAGQPSSSCAARQISYAACSKNVFIPCRAWRHTTPGSAISFQCHNSQTFTKQLCRA